MHKMIHAYCSICQESFNIKSEISVYPCGHVFHYCCIVQWLKTKSSCPNCRSVGGNKLIKKIYFDQVSEINNSFINDNDNHDDNDEKFSDLRSEISCLKMKMEELNNKNNDILQENKTLIDDLSKMKTLSHIQEMDISHLLDEKDDEILKYTRKLHTLRFVNEVINKSSAQIESKIEKLKASSNVLEEFESICTSLVVIKADRDVYKNKSETLSKELSRSETKKRILETKLESMKSGGGDSEDTFKTPIRTRSVRAASTTLDTPQMLMMASPETPSSSTKRRIHEETVCANPFSRNTAPSKKAKFDLSSLCIMSKKQELWKKRSS